MKSIGPLVEGTLANKSLQLSAWRSVDKASRRRGKSRCLNSDSGRQLNSMLDGSNAVSVSGKWRF